MQYRILPREEWDRLRPITDAPHPDTAIAAIAEDSSGNIAGVLFLQLTLHMEPLILKTPMVSFKRLYEMLLTSMERGTHFYAFSDKDVIDQMATHVGMRTMPYKVFEGQVK